MYNTEGFTLWKFASWLRSMPADHRYDGNSHGNSRSCSCPIALFIDGTATVCSAWNHYWNVTTPDWARDFISWFDAGIGGDTESQSVALRVLEKVEEKYASHQR